jgi:hypothetical protein
VSQKIFRRSLSVPIRVRAFSAVLALLLVPCFTALQAQHSANSNTSYQQLRGLLPGGEVINVNNLVLHRDAATFTFRHGSFALYGEVNGKVTGAVFKGDGHLHITPPTAQERHNLSIIAHSEEFGDDFDSVVLRFTDETAAELRKGAAGKGEPDPAYVKDAEELNGFLRHHAVGSYLELSQTFYYRKIKGNLDLRLLEDVLSPAPGGFFYAAIHGRKVSHLTFQIDPQGVPGIEPEEVALESWDPLTETMTYPLGFHRTAEYAKGTASGSEQNEAYRILSEDMDVSIDGGGALSSLATVEVHAEKDGVAVVPFNLYPSLRVSGVETDKGEALDFVQEKKNDDPDFGVVLAKPLKMGETAILKINYGGKEVVYKEGDGNYYTTAHENWYPSATPALGDSANYRMRFHVPKGLQLVATGTKVSEKTSGGVTTSEWKSDVPLTVVGFSLGSFKSAQASFNYPWGGGLAIDAYANDAPPDYLYVFSHRSMGTMDTTPMLPNILSQGEAATQVYTNFFGQLPFQRISLTQQTVCDYGQSWPTLVYLPICGFLDGTQRHELIHWHMKPDDAALFNMYISRVVPHEVAHQWWGNTVEMRSYRDEWMREGFADESATIYLQATQQMDQFFEFWKLQHRLITEKNAYGFRAIDVGPVTMGRRLSSPSAGWNVYQHLVYPKGAYILHMIRMMMWTPQNGDSQFKATMQDFVQSYKLKAATTEDFKAIVEKHMSPQMDLDGNHRMDWFFNQYVYGTALPAYHFEGQTAQNGDAVSLHIKLTQSGVSPEFKMPVPIYLELTSGKIIRLGTIGLIGNKTIERTVQLPKLPAPVKRVAINYYYDVLSIEN